MNNLTENIDNISMPFLRTSVIEKYKRESIKALESREDILSLEELEEVRQRLIESLESLYIEKGSYHTPIKIVTDGTFKEFVEFILKSILGEDLYHKYCSIIGVWYTDDDMKIDIQDYNEYSEENLEDNSILILLGSIKNVDEISYSTQDSHLLKSIEDSVTGKEEVLRNVRLLGVCFGHQLISSMLGYDIENCEDINFGRKELELNDDIGDFYKSCLMGVTNNGKNNLLNTVFTNTQKVSDNQTVEGVINLSKDNSMLGSTENRFITTQNHFEVARNKLTKFLLKKYDVPEDYFHNSNDDQLENAAFYGFHFFIPTLYQLSKEVKNNINKGKEKRYDQLFQNILDINKTILGELTGEIKEDGFYDSKFPRQEWITSLYNNGLLELNNNFDWKVSRGLKESGELFGISNIKELILYLKNFFLENGLDKDGVILLKDIGAGDGTLIEELSENLKYEDILVWGVGDVIYTDLFKSIKNSRFFGEIPLEVIKLFIKKFIQAKKEIEGYKGKDINLNINEILDNIELSSKTDVLFKDSMFSGEENPFSFNKPYNIGNEEKDFIESQEGQRKICELKEELRNNFYKYLGGKYVERIFLSDFSDYFSKLKDYTGDSDILKSHIQFSIRGTSHLDDEKYKNFILDYLNNGCFPGSIFIDDGVNKSYSGYDRLKELLEIKEIFGENINISILHDENTKKVYSAFIQVKPFTNVSGFDDYLSDGLKLSSLESISSDINYMLSSYIKYILSENIIYLFDNVDILKLYNERVYEFIEKTKYLIYNNNYKKLKQEFNYFIKTVGLDYLSKLEQIQDINNISYINKYYNFCRYSMSEFDNFLEYILNFDKEKLDINNDYVNKIQSAETLLDEFISISCEEYKKLDKITDIIEHNRNINENSSFENKDSSVLLPIFNSLGNIYKEVSYNEEDISVIKRDFPLLADNFGLELNKTSNSEEIKDDFERIDRKNLRILILDNSLVIQKTLKTIFSKEFEVDKDLIYTATNGEEALYLVENNDLDIAIMDIQSISLDSILAAKKIKYELGLNIPILSFSRNDYSLEESNLFDGHLPKPLTSTNILTEFCKIL